MSCWKSFTLYERSFKPEATNQDMEVRIMPKKQSAGKKTTAKKHLQIKDLASKRADTVRGGGTRPQQPNRRIVPCV